MKIFSAGFCTAVLLLTLSSCSKKSDPEQEQSSKTDLLVASSWKLDVAGIDQDKNGTIEFPITGLIPPCTADNTLLFKRDNTGTTDEGTTKCNNADPQTTALNWGFADTETAINISNSVLAEINGKSKILELSATALGLSKDTTLAGFGNAALIVKLKH